MAHKSYPNEGPRDPRFDPRVGGSSDPRHFVRNYAFLEQLRQSEANELQKALRKERNPLKKDKIKMTLGRYRNKTIDLKNKASAAAPRANNNKRPNKMANLVNKFKDLKSTGKLTKYIERKRKKLIKRDEKALS